MDMETQQVRLRLTNDKDLLAALKRNKRIVKDTKGEKIVLQFNSSTFDFRPGEVITVGKSVGDALVRSSGVFVDADAQSSPYLPTLDVLRTFKIDEPPEEDDRSKTMCPICSKETHSPARLAIHLQSHTTEDEIKKAQSDIKDKIAKDV